MVDFQERDTKRGLDEGNGDSASRESEDDDHGGHHDVDHDRHHREVPEAGIAVVTVSSSRSREEDASGDAIVTAVEDAGHSVVGRTLVDDDYDTVQRTVDAMTRRGDVDVVITTGGTGVTPDDVTIEAVRSLFEKELPGFGELFRRLSADEIGTRVIATRATGGVVDGVLIFCLPGSESGARLGTEEVILPEIGHLVGLANRGRDGRDGGGQGPGNDHEG